MLETTPLGRKGSWTLGSLPEGQSILNFSVKVITAPTRESCTAKAKQVLNGKRLEMHMLQQDAKTGISLLGNVIPSKYCLHHFFFARDGQIFSPQNSSELTSTELPKIGMLAASFKILCNFDFACNS